jgi:hypothetical protein
MECPKVKKTGQGVHFWFRASLIPYTEDGARETLLRLEDAAKCGPCKRIVAQVELGEGGVYHIQGYLHLNRKLRVGGVLQLLEQHGLVKRLTEVGLVAATDAEFMIDYCSKDDTLVNADLRINAVPTDGPKEKPTQFSVVTGWLHEFGEHGARLRLAKTDIRAKVWKEALERYNMDLAVERKQQMIEDLAKCTLLPWQQKIATIVENDPDPRDVWIVLDKKGNSGKTWLCRYLASKHPEEVETITNGKTADLSYIIAQKPQCTTVLVTLHRSTESVVNYQAIEQFKDGVFTSTKYQSTSITAPPKNIVLFSNYDPDWDALSIDRWKIMVLKSGGNFNVYCHTQFKLMYPRGYNQSIKDEKGNVQKRPQCETSSDESDIEGPPVKRQYTGTK